MHLKLKSSHLCHTYRQADYVSDSGEILYRTDTSGHFHRTVTIHHKSRSHSGFEELATLEKRMTHYRLTYLGREVEEKDVFRKQKWWKV